MGSLRGFDGEVPNTEPALEGNYADSYTGRVSLKVYTAKHTDFCGECLEW